MKEYDRLKNSLVPLPDYTSRTFSAYLTSTEIEYVRFKDKNVETECREVKNMILRELASMGSR
jgi:hypothetical protein